MGHFGYKKIACNISYTVVLGFPLMLGGTDIFDIKRGIIADAILRIERRQLSYGYPCCYHVNVCNVT